MRTIVSKVNGNIEQRGMDNFFLFFQYLNIICISAEDVFEDSSKVLLLNTMQESRLQDIIVVISKLEYFNVGKTTQRFACMYMVYSVEV